MKKYSEKISRGYRLKPKTHQLIKVLQEITENDADSVLNTSCNMYLNFVSGKNIENINKKVRSSEE